MTTTLLMVCDKFGRGVRVGKASDKSRRSAPLKSWGVWEGAYRGLTPQATGHTVRGSGRRSNEDAIPPEGLDDNDRSHVGEGGRAGRGHQGHRG